MDKIEELTRAFERFPGIGPRQARRFVFHLLSTGATDRAKIADLISRLGDNVRQCGECLRFATTNNNLCSYCSNQNRNGGQLLIVEKDQDLIAIERAGTYTGRYFVLGGVLTLSGKGIIREQELLRRVERRLTTGLKEIILALSATSEGENTTDHLKQLLLPYRDRVTLSVLGRGLSTGSELEYSDAQTLSGALLNRKET